MSPARTFFEALMSKGSLSPQDRSWRRLAFLIALALRENLFSAWAAWAAFVRSAATKAGRRAAAGASRTVSRPLGLLGALRSAPGLLARSAASAARATLFNAGLSLLAFSFAAGVVAFAFFLAQTTPGAPLLKRDDTALFRMASNWTLTASATRADNTLSLCQSGAVGFRGEERCEFAAPIGDADALMAQAIQIRRMPAKEADGALAAMPSLRAQALRAILRSFSENRALAAVLFGMLGALFALLAVAAPVGAVALVLRIFRPALVAGLSPSLRAAAMLFSVLAGLIWSVALASGALWVAERQSWSPALQSAALSLQPAGDSLPPARGDRLVLELRAPAGGEAPAHWTLAAAPANAFWLRRRQPYDDGPATHSSKPIVDVGFWRPGELWSKSLPALSAQRAPGLTPAQRAAFLAGAANDRIFVDQPVMRGMRGLFLVFACVVFGAVFTGLFRVSRSAGAAAKSTALRLAEQGAGLPRARHEREELAKALGDCSGDSEQSSSPRKPPRL
jgi:hypothetical protein